MKALQPLPVRADWAPGYLKGSPNLNRDFAFWLEDGQGAPAANGRKYHGGVDWFAPGGTPVVSPVSGSIVRVVKSATDTGQVFGGIIGVEADDGTTFVFRHVNPEGWVGQDVAAGQKIATVTAWRSGPAHAHIEVWKSADGGYRMENFLDPKGVEWVATAPAEKRARYGFEEVPHTAGGHGPAIVGQKRGYAKAAIASTVAATLRLRGMKISTLAADDGRVYVLSWKPGTHGQKYRWPERWANPSDRKDAMDQRAANTGRRMRPFVDRRNSLYPYPKES